MRLWSIFAVLFISAAAAVAEIPKNVVALPPLATDSGVVKKNLAESMIVRLPSITVVVPKGWSFNAAHYAKVHDKTTETITLTPIADIEHSKTVIGLRDTGVPPKVSLQELYQKYIEDENLFARFETWNEREWLLTEFESKEPIVTHRRKIWAARTVMNDREYFLTATTPIEDQEKFREQLDEVMSSVEIGATAGPN